MTLYRSALCVGRFGHHYGVLSSCSVKEKLSTNHSSPWISGKFQNLKMTSVLRRCVCSCVGYTNVIKNFRHRVRNGVISATNHKTFHRRHFHSRWTGPSVLDKLTSGEKWEPGTIPHLNDADYTKAHELEDRLFDYLSDENGRVNISRFIEALTSTGLRETDPRLRECMEGLVKHQTSRAGLYGPYGASIDRETFKECVSRNILLVGGAFQNQFVIPDFNKFCGDIDELYWRARDNIAGQVATYIPQLTRYSPSLWGVAICSVDGQRYSVGDTNVPFSIQSVSKPLTYAMVLDELSPKVVHEYVGHEPSGTPFNTLNLNYKDKPHNPMINSGAIAVCSLLKQTYNLPDRFDFVTQIMKRLTGGEYLSFNNSIFLSERESADRNFALGYYMREKKCFPEGSNLMEVMDFYFQMCSLEITCESGSIIAATLANGGVCPITGDKIFNTSSVRDTLSLMLSCGMYDYSGEFAFKVGLPAKSGVSGGIMIVIPNKMGIFVWSPGLDKWGNSVRGVQFAQDLVSKFSFHHYDNLRFTQKKINPFKRKIASRASEIVNLLFSAYNSDISALRRFALSDIDMDQSDYDGRTALHIGAAEGHTSVVQFLIRKCKCNPFVVDRWGFKPIDDAKRFKHYKVAEILQVAMDTYNADIKIDRTFQAIDSTQYGEITFNRDVGLSTPNGFLHNTENVEDEVTSVLDDDLIGMEMDDGTSSSEDSDKISENSENDLDKISKNSENKDPDSK